MTRTHRGSHRLPRLETPPEHDELRHRSPHDLRGANYSRIPDKNQPGGSRQKAELLPRLDGGEEHPVPYYSTGNVTFPALTDVPWKADEKRKLKSQAEAFSRDKRLQTLLVDEVIDDTIREEIISSASIVLEESKYEEQTDRNVVGVVEEFLVMPEVHHQVYLEVWSLLYDTGRSLTDEQFLKLKKREEHLVLAPVAKKALLDHVLEGEDWADDLTEEKLLSEISWDVLVYHYHNNLKENALGNNTAFKILQERMIMASAGEEVFKEGLLEALEDDLTKLDELEKMTTPPRQG